MALSPRLDVRQTQTLTLTPQLMASIRLLQLSHMELSAFVDAELLRNPLLESPDAPDGDTPMERERAEEIDPYRDVVDHSGHLGSATTIADSLDTDVSNVFPEQSGQDSLSQSSSWPEGKGGVLGGEAPDIDQYVSAQISLADHLAEQVNLIVKDPAERLIARSLVDNLDERGYLMAETGQIAEQLGTSPETVEAVLGKVQGCEPLGVFARSLAECLAIQLAEKDRLDPMMAGLLAHLDLVAGHDLALLGRKIGADREDILDMLAELRELDPRPGRAFDFSPVQSVVPDVFVKRGNDGGWQVELNSEVLPRVLVNRVYYASISKKTRDAEEKTFLVDCLNTANWLTKSLDQRAQTILKVATEIVKQQDGFLRRGISHLRPMTLKTVATEIEMHESTVSRVTANKYIATPRGLFEMKYFFTTALNSSSGGDDHSAEAVRHRIRQLIEAEKPDAILSDDTIAEVLKREQGIDVARRTVAKYREGMGIASSVIRRRQKKAQMA
ncbi:RNA polymerase factor sigma-54 [Pelagibacterium halotolerans]|uniref:RNA polymerase sigma-54 factor n=1 Tax=Pelagibacterium halotolerans (strain DSM 22347 / JCM 15775 / CGMCC 1.7692 / B2) TaxID=1082931 RepID=G4R8L4_PELHB|nr:RNA polymerase factor sigma-54 [Pelagibacterium halotolerans]AEQ53419.1 RNA polymerase sigma-54 factor RpoN [Pelagibacterium halotolerans B2]QJR20398.1 RNA polymerase factor sigma-54 [Pelagibacterium halotolerans]SEA60830.1 RNA polymerase, sigma 54 subunit, RpoN/SigL [Pelagibacterium halotolerans]